LRRGTAYRTLRAVSAVLRHPGVLRLLVLNVLARIPLAGSGVVLVVHVHALTGSYAVAGVVAAANGLATAACAPALGGLVDRRGQTAVLCGSALLCAGALVVLALLPHGAPVVLLVALAALAGAMFPPLGACLRTLWPHVLEGDRAAVQAAFALEAAVLELTYISGPLGFLTLAALTSTGLAIAALGITLAAGTLAFALQPASRSWRPEHHDQTARPSALRAPGVLTIAAVMGMVGVLVGGVEVAVTAAMNHADRAAATGPLLALWGIGSLLGGVAAARAGGPRGVRGLVLVLLALAGTHAVLAAGGESPVALGALLLFAGVGIAPLFGATSALTGDLALPGTSTEAFAWTTTALAAGVALGAAITGAIVDAEGAGLAFVVAGAFGVAGAAVAALRAPSLRTPSCAAG
jgi:predicted MFS family arabinose efflux permease